MAMPTIKISDFKSNLKDFARPNRFLLQFTGKGAKAAGLTDEMMYQVKTASIPGRTLGNIELNWFGCNMQVSGDTSFEDFSVTFLNDYEFKLRQCIEKWIEISFELLTTKMAVHTEYKSEILVMQLGRQGETIRKIKLVGAYPLSMDQIELSMESNDAIEEFTTNFKYDYWIPQT